MSLPLTLPILFYLPFIMPEAACYIPVCQTGNPQVCWLSNVVKPREQHFYSFGLLIYWRKEGSELGHAVLSVEQFVNHRYAGERRDLAEGVRGGSAW